MADQLPASAQQAVDQYNALVAQKADLSGQLSALTAQGVVWNDPRYEAVARQYANVSQQIQPAYETQKSAQNQALGISEGVSQGSGELGVSKTFGTSASPYQGGGAGNAQSLSSPTQIQTLPSNLPMANVYNQQVVALNAARQEGATTATVQNAVNTYNAQPSKSSPAAAQAQLAYMDPNLPAAGMYNLAVTAMNAARQEGATGSSVQQAVTNYNLYSAQNYNPVNPNGTINRMYVPEGNFIQQELSDVKIGVAFNEKGQSTGEYAIYKELPKGFNGETRYTVDPATGQLTNYMLIGGGGRNALQSGTVGFAAATPAVYAEGRVGQKEFTRAAVVAPGVATSGMSYEQVVSAVKAGTAGSLYSRLGSEAYGGIVTRLDARTLGNITYEDVSNRAAWNLASYVNPTDVNMSKADLPGVNIPWGVSSTAPAAFTLGTIGGVGTPVEIKSFTAYVGGESNAPKATATTLIIGGQEGTRYGPSIVASDRLVGGGKVASVAAVVPVTALQTTEGYSESLPKPGWEGRAESVFQEYGHATDITLSFVASIPSALTLGALPKASFTPFADQNARTGLGSDSPILASAKENINGANVASVNFMRSYDFAAAKSSLESTAMANTNSEGLWTGSKESLAVYNQNVATFNSRGGELKSLSTSAETALQAGIKSGAYVYRNGEIVENPDMVRPYGAASDWGVGASDVLTKSIGVSREQFAAYDVTRISQGEVKENPAYGVFSGIARGEEQKGRNIENAVYGFNRELFTRPENLVASAGSGAQIAIATAGTGEILGAIAGGSGISSGVARAAISVGSNPAVQYGVPSAFITTGVLEATDNFTLPAAQASMNVGGAGAGVAAMVLGGGAITTPRPVYDYATTRFAVKPETQIQFQGAVESGVVQPSFEGLGEARINYEVPYVVRELPKYTVLGYEISFPRLSNLAETERGVLTASAVDSTGASGSAAQVWSREYSINVDYFKGQALGRGNTELNINSLVASEATPKTAADYYTEAVATARQQRNLGATVNSQGVLDIANEAIANDLALASPKTAYRNFDLYVERGLSIPQLFDEMTKVPIKRDAVASTYVLPDTKPFGVIDRASAGRTGTNTRENYNMWIEQTAGDMGILSTDMSARRAIINDLQRRSTETIPRETEFATAYDSHGNLIGMREGDAHSVYPVDTSGHISAGEMVSRAHYHPNAQFSFRVLAESVGQDVWQFLTLGREASGIHPSSTITEAYLLTKSKGSMYYETPSPSDLRNNIKNSGLVQSEYIANREGIFVYDKPAGKYDTWDLIGGVNEIRRDAIFDYYGKGDRWALATAGTRTIEMLEAAGSHTEYIPNSRVYLSGEETITIPSQIQSRIKSEIPGYVQRGINDAATRIALKDQLLEFKQPAGRPTAIETRYSGGRPYGANTIAVEMQLTHPNRGTMGQNIELQRIAPDGATNKAYSMVPDRQLDNAKGTLKGTPPLVGITPQQIVSPMSIQKAEKITAYSIRSDIQPSLSVKQDRDTILAYAMGSDMQRLQKSDQTRETSQIVRVTRASGMAISLDVERVPMIDQLKAPSQKPAVGQTTRQLPDQVIIPDVKPVEPTKLVEPIKPIIPIPGIPWLPSGGGGGGGGYKKPYRNRKTEIFSYAPKNIDAIFGRRKSKRK